MQFAQVHLVYNISTNLTINESSFINNVANHSGGAIFARKSSMLLRETNFHSNSVEFNNGGGISCDQECQVIMVGRNTFLNNSCPNDGGAMYFSHCQLNITYGMAHFHFNEAGHGGAIAFLKSRSTLFSERVRTKLFVMVVLCTFVEV